MKKEWLDLILVFLGGMLTGIIFFWVLWYTVKKAIRAKLAALWFIISFMLRTSVALLAFYYLSEGNFLRLILCLAGFIIARILIKQITAAERKNKMHKKIIYEAQPR